ncbi:MBL fold metallo-hydrolase [Nocardioides sp. HM23]|uniref:MBL fold metallo-hydrolase n=1 Tax=Nocardioides bizhenqiangii TaxID=3095076 RepID=UPI002AC9F489|nr:MBL fold metallo-hydrolase [Nocardioides sp. HM23]MDZ5622235.1 MBL fold metallo-hydrolase [Nocardioides sp. HM23]
MSELEVVTVGSDVFLCRGRDANWVILREGTDLTLVDAGYPAYAPIVEESVRRIGGRPEDVRGIVVTHGHVDHIGGLAHFHGRYGTPVFAHPMEVPHVRRERLEQATPVQVARNAHRSGVLTWSLRITRAGALRDVAFADVQPLTPGSPLDLPGRPVPVATAGHTSGHTAYLVPSAGAVATGDGLCTGHATSPTVGPQLLPRMFQHGDDAAGLTPLEDLDADVVLPGHGPVHRGPIGEAVRAARESAAARKW